MIYDSVKAYNLSPAELERYLKELFPDARNEIEVRKKKMSDEYTLRIPRYLKNEEREHINEEIRYEVFDI